MLVHNWIGDIFTNLSAPTDLLMALVKYEHDLLIPEYDLHYKHYLPNHILPIVNIAH